MQKIFLKHFCMKVCQDLNFIGNQPLNLEALTTKTDCVGTNEKDSHSLQKG